MLKGSPAMSFGLLPTDSPHADRLRAAQIAGIARLTPLAMAGAIANAAIVLAGLRDAGELHTPMLAWAGLLLALALYHVWRCTLPERQQIRAASRRAIWRVAVNGALFGMVWGAVPILAYPDADLSMHTLIGCLTAGMMCAGAFVLATVPLAGIAYVCAIAAGAAIALLREHSAIDMSLLALLGVYTIILAAHVAWNAHLFVEHFMAAVRLQAEVDARERAQAEVAHAQRMSALGQLAGGVAHDFNNILQAVAGNAAQIAARAENVAQARLLAGRIIEAAERGGAIGRRLLAFAHQDRLDAEAVDASALLHGARDLLPHALGPGIELRVEVPAGLPRLLADKAQLEAVLVNLATNAHDAMPLGGVLTLKAETDECREPDEPASLKPGRYVVISVRDTGAGMDPETLARSTEPFFTTKPKGRGTGLGLAMAKGFAEQSGGGLVIESAVGRGTRVRLWLPRAEGKVARPAAAPRPMQVADVPRQHVLLVEDDEMVRETMVAALSGCGFAVACVAEARAALAVLDRGDVVDILVTDFAMPGLNGIELIDAALARRPDLPAILLTGHVGDVAAMQVDNNAEGARFTVLRKPIRVAQLADVLAKASGAGPKAGPAGKGLATAPERPVAVARP
ncbi:MAG TPA: ATP-binding protein [Acetobacteraceae bacterium]|nr:ATP-binding protein [Acetobacteraceae bacterium]